MPDSFKKKLELELEKSSQFDFAQREKVPLGCLLKNFPWLCVLENIQNTIGELVLSFLCYGNCYTHQGGLLIIMAGHFPKAPNPNPTPKHKGRVTAANSHTGK